MASLYLTLRRVAGQLWEGGFRGGGSPYKVCYLSAIYEADFLDCSFGFRPRRSAHQALRVVREAITTEPVNWVLDADIRRYLDTAS